MFVNGLYLHEIKKEVLLNYISVFEMIGSMLIGEIEENTIFIFRNVDDFEGYINAIDIDYDSDDVIFTVWLYKIINFQFKLVNRAQSGRDTDFE